MTSYDLIQYELSSLGLNREGVVEITLTQGIFFTTLCYIIGKVQLVQNKVMGANLDPHSFSLLDPHLFSLLDPDPHIDYGSGSRREKLKEKTEKNVKKLVIIGHTN